MIISIEEDDKKAKNPDEVFDVIDAALKEAAE
jgi:hypothetical protein